jgi:hypothetical protein
MRAHAYRHETWGIVGAIDDDDLERIRSLVPHLHYVQIGDRHEIHMVNPDRYVQELVKFVEELRLQ